MKKPAAMKADWMDVTIAATVGILAGACLTLPLVGAHGRLMQEAQAERRWQSGTIHTGPEERCCWTFAPWGSKEEEQEQDEAEEAMDRDADRAQAERLGNVAPASLVLAW